MPKSKIKWLEIKQKYFESEIEEVREFLTKHQLNTNQTPISENTLKQNTKGWRKEKLEYKKKIFEKSTIDIAKHPDVQDRVRSLIEAIQKVEKRVADLISLEQFTIDDLPKVKVGYDMLRLATGQSTQNTNIAGKNGGAIETDSVIRIIKL